MLGHFLIFCAGLTLLSLGADQFLRGATGIARRFGVKEFVIGMVLVGFGTSAPELTVNLAALYQGRYDLAIGNVVGSNIANIGLILGISALVAPLVVQMRLVRVETPLLIVVSLGFLLLCLDGSLSRLDGLILLLGFTGLITLVAMDMKQEPQAVQDELADSVPQDTRDMAWVIVRCIGGLAGLVIGAQLMVESAVAIARILGMSELVIGLTIVAIGTSLPELASSVIAALRGQVDIALGNVLGSCLFNLLLIIGVTASIHPLPVGGTLMAVELPVMLIFAIALLPMMLRRMAIGKTEGLVLLSGYVGFIGWQLWVAFGRTVPAVV
jgi:cation:H+ antiporter